MIVQEPVQAAIWHCLNHYDYTDAIFLSERLYAEVKTDDSLFLLATSYYRNAQVDHAYHLLKDRACSTQCRYLLGNCAYQLQKYAEAENAIMDAKNVEDLISDFKEQAAFALLLLGKIAEKTGRKQHALDMYKRALKLNPFLWSSFENMCEMGEPPNPASCFQLNDIENLSQCHGTSLCNVESLVIPHSGHSDNAHITTPHQILGYATANHHNTAKACTPDESPLANPLCMSGIGVLPTTRLKNLREVYHQISADTQNPSSPTNSPSFGYIIDRSDEHNHLITPTINSTAESSEQKPFVKRGRMHMNPWGNRKDGILQNSKPVFSQTSNVNVNNALTITPSTPAPNTMSGAPNVRRSSRLFSSNNYSVKENNKSPNRSKFATPKSPSRKTKQRLAKCSLNEFNNYMDVVVDVKNIKSLQKKITETATSTMEAGKASINSAINVNNNSANALAAPPPPTVPSPMSAAQLQKQSAEGLMCLLREIGQACVSLAQFKCKTAVEELMQLPPHQMHTAWVYCKLGLAYFEIADYENSAKYFGEVHSREPHRLKYMDVYSTALWHLQKEVALSALAQDLIQLDKNSPITWIVSGNCFSLHKEHDTAIKFLHRAVQVDPNHPYAYTILGHEYIMTEELDKAMSCYRNAIRLDPRHYNAWFGIGTIYSKQERFHSAEINYSRALTINPHSSVILCHIGVVQHALKKTEKALGTLNAAIANEPKNALCKFHRGSIYFNLGRHGDALKELEELKEIVPKESLVYYMIGKVHKKLGNIDLALMHFSWATDLDPKGASSQIKEAFDPSIGRVAEAEQQQQQQQQQPQQQQQQQQPGTPLTNDEPQPADNNSLTWHRAQLMFARLNDDSDNGY